MSNNQDVLTKIAAETQTLLGKDTYVVALISMHEYTESMCCPHCLSSNGTATLDPSMDLQGHIAELHLCQDCAQLFIICEYPTLFETSVPVFLQITVRAGENPRAEVVATEMAKAIMAQGDIPTEPVN